MPHRAVHAWKSGLCLRPRNFQSFWVWVLPVEYVALDFSRRVRSLVQQWIHVLRESLDEFQLFLRCGKLDS